MLQICQMVNFSQLVARWLYTISNSTLNRGPGFLPKTPAPSALLRRSLPIDQESVNYTTPTTQEKYLRDSWIALISRMEHVGN